MTEPKMTDAERIEQLEAENARMREALERICHLDCSCPKGGPNHPHLDNCAVIIAAKVVYSKFPDPDWLSRRLAGERAKVWLEALHIVAPEGDEGLSSEEKELAELFAEKYDRARARAEGA